MLSGSFDIIIIGIVVFAVIRGYVSGLIMQLATLIGLICCAFFAGKAATVIYPFFVKFTGISGYLSIPLSYLLSFIVIMLVFYVIGKMLDGIIKVIQLSILNKLAGAFFSVVKWLILASILLNLIILFDPNEQLIKREIKGNSLSYPYVKPLAPSFIPFLKNL